jgi:ketosteroid isomerase-like protein
MRLTSLLLGGSAALLISASAARAQLVPVPENNSASERQRYRAEAMRDAMFMLGNWQNAWARDDVNGILRQYDPNALLVLPEQPERAQGTSELRALLQARLAALGRIEFQLVDAEVGDRLIYLYQRFTIAPANEAADLSTPPAFNGTCTTVLESNAEGRWRIRAQVFIPGPPTAASSASAAIAPNTPRG